MPHILHVIDSLAPGGAERMLVDIANATTDAGLRASVCVTRSVDTLAAELRPAITRLVLRRQRRFDWSAMRRLDAFVRSEQVDVLHIHGRSSLSFIMVARLCGLLRGVPALLHDHYGRIEIDQSKPAWFRLIGRHMIAAYVGVSPLLGEWARTAGVPQQRITVIENGIDLMRLRPAERAPADLRALFSLPSVPVGVVVCGIRPEKGVDLALEALARTAHQAALLIVGADTDPIYAEECRAQAARIGLNGRVVFAGVRTDVPVLLGGADFACMPSRSESGPLVLIEYAAAGLPLVSSRAGSIGIRLADAGVPGFVPPGDAGALAAALDDLLSLTPEARRARGEQGRRAAEALFSIQAQLPRWQALYLDMTGERGRA